MLQSKTLNTKSRTVCPTRTPFLYSRTITPTTKSPIILGLTVRIPVLGSITVLEPGPRGDCALNGPIH